MIHEGMKIERIPKFPSRNNSQEKKMEHLL